MLDIACHWDFNAGTGLQNERVLTAGTIIVGDILAGQASFMAGKTLSVDENKAFFGVARRNAGSIVVN